MASSRHLFTTQRYGSNDGTEFQDESLVKDLDGAAIHQITIGHDTHIRSLTVYYGPGTGSTIRHGGPDGKVDVICLEPDEYITIIEGSIAEGAIAHLKFTTNKRSYGDFGNRRASDPFTLRAFDPGDANLVPQMGILYFSGQYSSNGYMTAIQATFAEQAARSTSKKLVNYEEHTTDDDDAPQTPAPVSTFAKNLMSPIVVLRVGSEGIRFSTNQDALFKLPFFRAALQGQFREASEKTISMPEDDVDTISALIEFLYIGRYTYPYLRSIIGGANRDSSDAPISDSKEGSFHATLYAVASKYGCQELADIALGNFKCVLNELKGFEVIELLKAAYKNDLLLSELDGDAGLAGFRKRLSELISGLYTTHREEMENIVAEYPKLGSDLLCLVTRGKLV